MQKSFILFVFFALSTIVNAQDRIITVKQDTIHCQIVSIGTEHINYEQKSTNGYVVGKSIPIDQVATYFRLPRSSSNISSRRPERPWLFGISPGGSWMPWLFEDVEDVPDYAKKIATGFHLNVSGHYLITNFFGAGIQYSFFHSSTDGEYPIVINPYYPTYTMSSEKEKQYINYIGASIIFQQFLDKKKKFQLSETLSGGMLFYRGESQTSTTYLNTSYYGSSYYAPIYFTYSRNTLITGRTFGATAGLSAEYYVIPSLSIGIGGDFLFGSLKKVNGEVKDSEGGKNKIKDQELDEPIKLSRIDYSLSLRFHF
jgi:hypothetical protein